jgi:hypothetical protein
LNITNGDPHTLTTKVSPAIPGKPIDIETEIPVVSYGWGSNDVTDGKSGAAEKRIHIAARQGGREVWRFDSN